VHFFTFFTCFNWLLILALLWKKWLPCQSIDRSNGVAERSKCKLYSQKVIDSFLIQWHMESSDYQYSSPIVLREPVGVAVIFLGAYDTFYTLLKWQIWAHWCPSSWWCPRQPPSLLKTSLNYGKICSFKAFPSNVIQHHYDLPCQVI